MKCDKVRELLLTDYVDSCLSDKLKDKVEKHIATCHGCRAFYAQAMSVATGIYKGTARVDAPEYLWHRIKREIVAQKEIKKPWHVWGNVDIFQIIPKPALVMAAVVMLILANVVGEKFIFTPKVQAKSGEILSYLEGINDFGADSPGLGTDIERFL